MEAISNVYEYWRRYSKVKVIHRFQKFEIGSFSYFVEMLLGCCLHLYNDFYLLFIFTGDYLWPVLLPEIHCRSHGIDENPEQDLTSGVNDTGDNLSPVTMTLAIINRRCCWHWWTANISLILRKNLIGPNRKLRCQGETGLWKKPEVENLVSDSL